MYTVCVFNTTDKVIDVETLHIFTLIRICYLCP